MAGVTPPAPPSTNPISSAFSQTAHTFTGVFANPALLLILVLIVLAPVILKLLASTRQAKSSVWAILITPERRFIRVPLPAQLGGRYTYTEGGRTVVFMPRNEDMLVGMDGKERLFVGFAVPVAVGGDVKAYVATSLNPLLAHDADVVMKTVRTAAGEVTVTGGLGDVLEKLLQGQTRLKSSFRDPVYDVEIAYSIDLMSLASKYIESQFDIADRLITSLLSTLSIESRINRMFELMIKAKEVTSSNWARMLLIAGMIIIILLIVLSGLHIL